MIIHNYGYLDIKIYKIKVMYPINNTTICEESNNLINGRLKCTDSVLHLPKVYKDICGAVIARDTEAVLKFINDDVNVSAADIKGNGPLYYAILAKDHKLVNILLDSGAGVNAVSPAGFSLLYYAIKGGCVDICKMLIKAGAYINAVGNDGYSILYHAIETNSLELVKLLIFPRESDHNVANVNFVGFGGFSIFYHSIKKGNAQIVEQLIEADIDVNLASCDRSPLYQSVMSGNIDIVRLLLKTKARMSSAEIETIRENDTDANNSDCVELLVKSLANDASILAQAVENENLYFIKLLIRQGINVSQADKSCSILYKAINKGNTDIVKLLIDNGADASGREDNVSHTPQSMPVLFRAAIQMEDVVITNLLINNRANIYNEYNGCTILHHAIKKCNSVIVMSMLTSNNAADRLLNAQTINYCNALELALMHSTPEIVEILIKNRGRITSKTLWQTSCISYEDFIVKMPYENLRRALDNIICIKDFNTVCIDYRTICDTESSNVDETLSTLWLLSEQEKFRDLLPSPVFTAFIQWMWQSNLSTFFTVNVIFCLLFYMNLFWYQTVYYAADDSRLTVAGYFAYSTLALLTLAFVCREATQLYLNCKSYRQNFENYIELLLLFYVGCTLTDVNWFHRAEIVGMCNILMALSVTLLLGHTDYAATPVNILRTVSFTFIKYFTPYALIFLAFAFTFYQLFYSDNTIEGSNEYISKRNNSKSSESVYFFEIIRVLGKFTGELQVSDVSQDKYTFLPFVISAGFIFLCPIIMLNLLNGLAVSDILNEENLKIFMQKSRLNYLRSAQIYYNIPLFKSILNCFWLKLHLDNFNTIYIYSNKPARNNTCQFKVTRQNREDFPLLISCNNSFNNLLHKDVDSFVNSQNSIFNNKIIKDATDIVNKLDLSRSENLQQEILIEVSILHRMLLQMNDRFSKLDNELEDTRYKLNKRTDELLQKIKNT